MTETKQKSDLSRAFSEDGALKTHVGGQALLEGIMMRGKYNWSVAVREPEGTIYTEEHDLAFGQDKSGWLYWPFVRGCRAFVESLALGYKALSIAAEHAFVEEEEEGDEAPASDSGDPIGQRGDRKGSAQKLRSPRSALQDAPLPSGEPIGGEGSFLGNAADDAGKVLDCGSRASEGEGVGHEGQLVTEGFSWARDFGNPDEMIDGLAAQRVLEVIDGDTGLPVRFEDEDLADGLDDADSCANVAHTIQAGDNAEDDISPIDKEHSGGRLSDMDANSANTAHTDTESTSSSISQAPAAGEKPEKKPLLGDKELAVSMILGLVLGVVLFIVVPAALTNLIVGEYDDKTLLWNVVDGLLRIAVFVFYIWLIGRMSDIKRMFGYHGAEHKTIHCFEHGLPLTPENARSFPRLHVRCGTAFLIMVMIIAIFVYTITPLAALISAWGVPDGPIKLVLVIVVRILLMPLIAGISYEITVKWAGSHPDNPLVKVILWPGMQMQYLTTREPDDGQIECAIAAMQIVLDREQSESAA